MQDFALFPVAWICPIIVRRAAFLRDLGGFMHWLKWLIEIWIVFGVVFVIAGLIWTTRLSSEMNPEIGKMPAASERQFGTTSLSKVRSA
jgi:hypothetical protein